jgi:hypothetical protein
MTTIELRLLFLAGVILMAVVLALAAGATLALTGWIGAVRPRLTGLRRSRQARAGAPASVTSGPRFR